MKIRALKTFEGIRDNERSIQKGIDIYPKEGDIWEVSEERANFLKSHGVVEIVEEKSEEEVPKIENVDEKIEEIKESAKEEVKKNKKKKKEQE